MTIVELGRALACTTRRRALELVAQEGPLPVGVLAARVGVTTATMTYHLGRLSGLVTTRRKGRRTLIAAKWRRLEIVGELMS